MCHSQASGHLRQIVVVLEAKMVGALDPSYPTVRTYSTGPAAGGAATVSRTPATSLLALRIPNAATTSKTPRMINQMPTTLVRIAMDSNGDASMTTPATRLMAPMKISQPRPGSVGSLIADTA